MSSVNVARSRSTFWLNALALTVMSFAIGAVAWKNSQAASPRTLLNVSFEPTRELFRDLNPAFVKSYESQAGIHLVVKQSHGASLNQLEEPAGFEPDVVTLALPSDINNLQRKGLISAGWASRLPYASQPYASTIVFVVHKGNPKSIFDWPDLVRSDLSVVIPDPQISATGKLSVLAAWGSVIHRGGTESSALAYLRQLCTHAVAFDSNKRDATANPETSNNGKLGDVRLARESEARFEIAQSPADYEIVYPLVSLRVEPVVAWVDSAVARHHSEAAAKAYLEFLYSTSAQEILAQHGYRPSDPAVLKRYEKQFPAIELFPVGAVAKNWEEADRKFFASGGILEQVHPVTVASNARP